MTIEGRVEPQLAVNWPWEHQTPLRKTSTLYIGGIFPMSGAWAGGMGCRPAVDIALEDINDRTDLLPNFSLQMLANDSQVSSKIVPVLKQEVTSGISSLFIKYGSTNSNKEKEMLIKIS